ncbi:MAG TPA: CBS domain-containing protein [Phototrophicaceae bacterium]|jgi:CBS domain-containing protein|nr:CBS domain-containing protein [Phototrophicaceae bacterium]
MLKDLSVKEWMTSPVITVSPGFPITAADRFMNEKNVRRLVVVDEHGVLGLVTKGDIREAKPSDATSLSIWELNYLLAQLTVDKVMTRNLLTVHPHDSISHAARLMLEHKVSGLPVLDDAGKLVGIITESDMFRMLITSLEAVSV